MQLVVRQSQSSPTSKGYSKRKESLKKENGKDNLSPSTQIISMAIVMHAIILDINVLNVKCIQKGEQSIVHQLKHTLVK